MWFDHFQARPGVSLMGKRLLTFTVRAAFPEPGLLERSPSITQLSHNEPELEMEDEEQVSWDTACGFQTKPWQIQYNGARLNWHSHCLSNTQMNSNAVWEQLWELLTYSDHSHSQNTSICSRNNTSVLVVHFYSL